MNPERNASMMRHARFRMSSGIPCSRWSFWTRSVCSRSCGSQALPSARYRWARVVQFHLPDRGGGAPDGVVPALAGHGRGVHFAKREGHDALPYLVHRIEVPVQRHRRLAQGSGELAHGQVLKALLVRHQKRLRQDDLAVQALIRGIAGSGAVLRHVRFPYRAEGLFLGFRRC